MRVVIDTNVLISAVMKRDIQQQRQAAHLFQVTAESQVELLVPQCAVFEFIYVLENVYGVGSEQVRTLVGDLSRMPSLSIVDELDSSLWLRIWKETVSTPNDAAVAAVASATHSAVATFDRKLSRRLQALSVEVWKWSANKKSQQE